MGRSLIVAGGFTVQELADQVLQDDGRLRDLDGVAVLQIVQIAARRQTDILLAQQAGSEHPHTVYVQPTADVRRGDELRDGDQVFRVLSVVEPSSPVYRKAECQLVQKEGA